jgi:hypothetical protein
MEFKIEGDLPTLNEYVNANRANRYVGNNMLRDAESVCWVYIQNAKVRGEIYPTMKPYEIEFEWHRKNAKTDIDNVVVGQKFIIDSLRYAGILPNDSPKFFKAVRHNFFYDTKQNYVVVRIKN